MAQHGGQGSVVKVAVEHPPALPRTGAMPAISAHTTVSVTLLPPSGKGRHWPDTGSNGLLLVLGVPYETFTMPAVTVHSYCWCCGAHDWFPNL